MIADIIRKTRSLGICLLAMSFLGFLASCDEEDNSTFLWSPAINVEKGDGEAEIFLTNPTPFIEYLTPPTSPTHFTIMISEDFDNFSEYLTVDSETSSVLIKDLINERPYYFFVTAHKSSFQSVTTDTLTTIPSKALARDRYTHAPNGQFERFSTSFDQTYGLYRVNDKYYQYKSVSPDLVHLVDDHCYYASWSSNTNQLVYIKNTLIGSASYPSALNIFDTESQTSTTLLTIPYENYLADHPLFAPDGNKITFLSTEHNPVEMIYELWSIDLVTKEKVKLSDFEGAGFVTHGSFTWDESGQEIYLDGAFGFQDADVYKFNVATKLLTPLIVSKWGDHNPVISPDSNTIAFISNRSCRDELWIYDLTNSKLKQITGESDYDFDSRYSEIQWLDNDRLLITVGESTGAVPVTINVNQ